MHVCHNNCPKVTWVPTNCDMLTCNVLTVKLTVLDFSISRVRRFAIIGLQKVT